MRWLAVSLLALGACHLRSGTAIAVEGDAPPSADAALRDAIVQLDAAPDAYDDCLGTGLFRTCLMAPPQMTYSPGGTLNTTNDAACTMVTPSGAPTVCLITAQTITISAAVTVIGSHPLVLIATDTITVSAALDVSSHRGGTTGAGASAG
jgi:hypothetical protein